MPDFIEWHGMPPMVKKLKYRKWLYDTLLRPYLEREAADGELLDDEWWTQWFFDDFGLHRKIKNRTALSNEEEEE